MAINPSLAIQRAVFALLNSDSILSGDLSCGVFDTVKQGQVYPYITINDIQSSDWGSQTFDGVDAVIVVNVWSQQGSSLEARNIMSRLYAILHNPTGLVITGFNLCQIRFENEHCMVDPDGITHHGIQRFKILVAS